MKVSGHPAVSRRHRTFLAVAALTITWACAAPQLEVMAIANEGFLIRSSSRAVLVDALFRATAPFPTFYQQAPSDNLLETMINGGGAFESIELVLVTHADGDHFHAPTVAQFMGAHPESALILTEEARELLAAEPGFGEFSNRVQAPAIERGACESLQVDSLAVQVCSLLHSGEREMANNVYRVDLDGFSFVHEGDAERDPEAFRGLGLQGEGLDLALLHDWFVFSPEGLEILEVALNPAQVVLMHHRWDAAPEARRRLAELDEENTSKLPHVTVLGAETARVSLGASR